MYPRVSPAQRQVTTRSQAGHDPLTGAGAPRPLIVVVIIITTTTTTTTTTTINKGIITAQKVVQNEVELPVRPRFVILLNIVIVHVL